MNICKAFGLFYFLDNWPAFEKMLVGYRISMGFVCGWNFISLFQRQEEMQQVCIWTLSQVPTSMVQVNLMVLLLNFNQVDNEMFICNLFSDNCFVKFNLIMDLLLQFQNFIVLLQIMCLNYRKLRELLFKLTGQTFMNAS